MSLFDLTMVLLCGVYCVVVYGGLVLLSKIINYVIYDSNRNNKKKK